MFASRKIPSVLIAAAYLFSVVFSTLPVSTFTPLVSAAAPSCDVTLNPGDSIQAAITAATAGDVICLNPGTYPQASTITVDEEVTIIRTGCDPDVIESRTAGSASEAIINGGGAVGTIFDIDADYVTLACLEVKGSTGDMIYADPAGTNTNTVIKNNIIHDSGDEGVQLRGSPGAVLQYNEVYDTTGDGLNLADGSDGGQILNNKVHDINSTNGAIYIYNSEYVDVKDNLLYGANVNDAIKMGNKGGSDLTKSGGTISGNVIANGAQDAITIYMSDVTVTSNKMTASTSANGAIYVRSGTDNIDINNNLIKNNSTTGIKVSSATNVVVNNNCIEGNNAGVTYSGAGTLDAENNWWGAVSGPSGSGPGTGDSVGASIDFTPFNTTSCGLEDIFDNDPVDGIPDGVDDPLSLPSGPVCTPNDTSLHGYWRFDESTLATTAVDSSTFGNDGTYNSPSQSTSLPIFTYGNLFSRDFDGVDDYVSAGDDASLNFERTDAFSASAWIKRDTTGKIDVILSKRQSADYRGYVFYVTADDKLELNLQNSNANRLRQVGSTALSAGTWYHVAFSYDGSSLAAGVKLFIDGVEEVGVTAQDTLTDTIQSTGDFEIGDQTVLSLPFAGLIDDVRVYNRVLTEAQASELFAGECEDTGAVPADTALLSGGANGFRYRQNQLIKKLNNFGNSSFVNSPTPPAGFGGPEYFGGGTELLDWDQLSAVCIVHDEFYQDLYTFDIIEFMAENFAHLFGVSEEFILDIIQNGTFCDTVYSAQAEDERYEQELIAQAEQEKYEELMAMYHMYGPETIDFAVGEDGYPVSSDMIWNACIRNFEVFIDGESKPLNCRRYHDGNMWEHPDTFVTFDWSPRLGNGVTVRGYEVATYIVETPNYYASDIRVVQKGNVVTKYILPVAKYMAVKGSDLLQKIIATVPTQETVVLSEEEVTISQ